jgi:hypothetical protein
MSRSIARAAFVGMLLIATVTACVFVGHRLPAYWGVGLGGGLGSLVIMYAGKWFDRRWPKPKQGWAE